ncbi:diguanylate cyclase [Spirochaetia bacterium]|nr:diguanylate cyclase [Spirochaetia bacterium]
MKEFFLMFARYNQQANQSMVSIVDKLSNDEREKGRGSYFGSLSGLLRHTLDVVPFFLNMFKDAVANNAGAVKAIASLEGLAAIPEKGSLTEAQWKQLKANFQTADEAYVRFITALSDADLQAPVKIEWYGGNPASVPLSFMLSQFIVHNTHHRGQVSQILDELKIDNDYSGIDVAFLPK